MGRMLSKIRKKFILCIFNINKSEKKKNCKIDDIISNMQEIDVSQLRVPVTFANKIRMIGGTCSPHNHHTKSAK